MAGRVRSPCIANNPRAGHKHKREVAQALYTNPKKVGSSMGQPKKQCHVCYPKQKEIRTHYIGCPDQPGLCSIKHFRAFHSRNDK